MDTERFKKLMEEDYAYNSSLKVRVFQGLLLMRKYIPTATIESAEHDIVYSVGIEKLVEAGITEEDVKALRDMNWHIEGGEYLAHFV